MMRTPSQPVKRTQSQSDVGSQVALNRYVERALELRKNRDDSKYNFLVAQLRDPPSAKVLTGWVRALAAHATRLGVDSSRELLAAVFRVDWTVDEELQEAFLLLVLELATSHSTYCMQMFRALLAHVHPKRVSAAGEVDRARTERAVTAVVRTLQQMCKLVPLASAQLQAILVEMYPHPRFDIDSQRNWQRVALSVCSFVPKHKEAILSVLVTRLLQMDVDIKVIGEDDELFALDLDAAGKTVFNAETNSELAAKMDALMDRLFEYVDTLLSPQAQDRDASFHVLLNIFCRSVLTTAKSKYVQFLLFKACSLDESYFEQFAQLLLRKATADDTAIATATRVTAASYLSSLLARASFVTPEALNKHLCGIIKWAAAYSRAFAAQATQGIVVNASEHTLFYAMVQAAMYVICYAYPRAAPEGKALQWLFDLGIAEVLAGPLMPMRVCHDAVVQEFVSVAAKLGEPRLDVLRRAGPSIILPATQAGLYFPFDPYLLRHSSRHIQPLYISWSSEVDEDEEEEEDEQAQEPNEDGADASGSSEEDGTTGSSRQSVGLNIRSAASSDMATSVGASTSMETSSYSKPIPRRDSTGFAPMSIPRDECANFHLVPD
eukprot:m51a1_g1118 hypothetical protein (607) ;mRNA; r:166752-169317